MVADDFRLHRPTTLSTGESLEDGDNEEEEEEECDEAEEEEEEEEEKEEAGAGVDREDSRCFRMNIVSLIQVGFTTTKLPMRRRWRRRRKRMKLRRTARRPEEMGDYVYFPVMKK